METYTGENNMTVTKVLIFVESEQFADPIQIRRIRYKLFPYWKI